MMDPDVDRYRNYLRFLADVKLDRQLRGRVDPSDIVQDTMLQACAAWGTFRGEQSCQVVAWLQRILMRTVLHALRDARRAKRDVRREQRLDKIMDQSSQRIEAWIAHDEASPSEAAQHAEEMLQIADAVYELPEAERIAVMGYYWQGATLAELGEEMNRTPSAMAGLVHRGVSRLRGKLAAAAELELPGN